MKKITLLLFLLFLLQSCTSNHKKIEILQNKYPNSIVYEVTRYDYVVYDSIHIYHIIISGNGHILTTVNLKK